MLRESVVGIVACDIEQKYWNPHISTGASRHKLSPDPVAPPRTEAVRGELAVEE